MAFEILRATNLCIRGRRKKWRSTIGMDDGVHPVYWVMNRDCMCSNIYVLVVHFSFKINIKINV